jgi:hypothetical protein
MWRRTCIALANPQADRDRVARGGRERGGWDAVRSGGLLHGKPERARRCGAVWGNIDTAAGAD